MESLNMIKIKKAKAIHGHTYRRLRKIAALVFRFFELFLFIMVVSRFTTQLPLAFRISADYFTGLSLSLFTPGSVFLIGNAIILLLFLISGTFSSSSSAAADGKQSSTNPDYYEDYVKRNHKTSNFHHQLSLRLLTDQDKQITKDTEPEPEPEPEPEVIIRKNIMNTVAPVVNHDYEDRKKIIIERSQSENKILLDRDHPEEKSKPKPYGRLTRTLTATCRREVSSREDEMSSEEFQQTVEDFIARQQRLLREEMFGSVPRR